MELSDSANWLNVVSYDPRSISELGAQLDRPGNASPHEHNGH